MLQIQKITSAFTLPALFLTLVMVIYSIGHGMLLAKGEDSPILDFLFRAGTIWALVWWLKLDSRRHGVGQVYCLGLLAITGGVILFPYHLVRTRGVFGFLLMLMLLALLVVCSVLGGVAFLVFGGPLDSPVQP